MHIIPIICHPFAPIEPRFIWLKIFRLLDSSLDGIFIGAYYPYIYMSQIKNLGNRSVQDLQYELDHGARFIVYRYCISVILITFRRSSDIYLILGNESRVAKGLGFTFLTVLLGWWGIPWGPIYTIQSLVKNLGGGDDVTDEVVAALIQGAADQQAPSSQ